MACGDDKRTYISAPIEPGFAQLPDVPKNQSQWIALKNFLQAVKNVVEGTTPNNPVMPFAITGFAAATTTTGVRLTWNPDKNSAFYVIHRNKTNNFDQSRIVCAMYADSGKPSFFDVGGQDDTGTPRYYWIRGYGPTGAPGPLVGPLISADPGIGFEAEMIGPKTGTLITLSDGTTKAVEDLLVGDELWPIDPTNPIVITELPSQETKVCIEFETEKGKTLTITENQLVHEYDGGMIPAIALVVGNEIRTIDGNEVITKRTKVGEQTVWRVRLNQKMWYPANRIWIWGIGTGTGAVENSIGFTGDSTFEMVTRPQQSVSSTQKTYNSTLLRFDPAWFNGSPVFSIEVEAANSHPTLPYTVTVEDASDLTVIHAFTVPANQTNFTWQTSGAISWPSGARTLRMRLAQTASSDQLKVARLRIRVNMTNATTPVFYYPFIYVGLAINEDDLVSGDSRFTGGDSGWLEESNAALFLKEAGAWGDVDHWSFDAVLGNTGGLGTNHAMAAFTRKDGAIVASVDSVSELSVTELLTTDFSHTAANFTDDDEFTVFSRATTTFFNNTLILKTGIYCFYSEFKKGNLFYALKDHVRNRITPDNFHGLVSAHYEVTAEESGAGTAGRKLATSDDPDETGVETDVTGAVVDPTNGTKTRYRVDFDNPLSEHFYTGAAKAGTGSIAMHGEFVILKVIGSGTGGPYYYRMQRDFEESESSTELSFRIARIGEDAETERAKLFASGLYNAVAFGILNGNQGIDFDGDPRRLRRIRIDKGLVTLDESADSSSLCICPDSDSSGGGGFDGLTLDWTASIPTPAVGRMAYDSVEDTIVFYDSHGSPMWLGHTLETQVRNESGVNLVKGDIVYVSGGHSGGLPKVTKAKADASGTSANTIGVCVEAISNNAFGSVLIHGVLNNFDTSAWSVGDSLYLSAATAGAMTNTAPSNPNYRILLAVVTKSNATSGRAIFLTAAANVTDAAVLFSDITTGNAATGQHGFLKKLSGNSTDFMNGAGNWAVPSGASSFVLGTTAFGSEPGSPNTGDADLYTNAPLIARYDGAAWAPWGPLFKFTAPVNGDYAWINQGSASAVTTYGGVHLSMTSGSGDNWRIRKKSAPSTPYYIVFGFIGMWSSVNYNTLGFCWRQSSGGAAGSLVGMCIQRDSWQVKKMNSPSSFNTSQGFDNPLGPGSPNQLFWLQMCDDGTNRKVWGSSNGIAWQLYNSEGRTSFITADEVGFFVDPNNSNHGCALHLLHWSQHSSFQGVDIS